MSEAREEEKVISEETNKKRKSQNRLEVKTEALLTLQFSLELYVIIVKLIFLCPV